LIAEVRITELSWSGGALSVDENQLHGHLAFVAEDDGVAAPLTLRKELNLFDAVAIIVGTVIGSGIVLIPSFIAAQLHSLAVVLFVWVVGGVLTVFGSLSLAELGSIYPGTGGLCTYLRHAYGPLPAFLYAWALLLMIHSGSIAGLAVAFGLFAGQILPLNTVQEKVLSAAFILALTTINCFGIRGGKLVQNLIAVAKISGLAAIILLTCIKGTRPFFEAAANTSGHAFSLTGFGIALVAVLWTYEGWHVISFVAGEMKRPQVDLRRSLFYGTAIIMLTYLVANLGYYHVLSAAEIQGSNALAAFALGKLFGPFAAAIISVLILVSIVGCMNGLVLTGPRVYYALARAGVFPRIFGQINDRYLTPMSALLVQGVWASALAVSGSYQQIFTDVIFTAWIFYGLGAAAVLVLRNTQPQLERPFRVPGYPWVPLLFCTAAIGLVLSVVIRQPGGAFIGAGLVACGIPVYFFSVRSSTSAV
jgi:APA family basic amino acid/polyamine antiporter